MPDQTDVDFFDEIATALEKQRVLVVKRLEANQVDVAYRPGARELQYQIRVAFKLAEKIASAKTRTAGGGDASQ
jgi:hypothetical protein